MSESVPTTVAPTISVILNLATQPDRGKYRLGFNRLGTPWKMYFFLSEAELESLAQALVDLTSSRNVLEDIQINGIRKFI